MLRAYQSAAVDGLFAWWGRHDDGNALLVVPTGGGKSWIIAAIVERCVLDYPNIETRILVLHPSLELIEQNLDKLRAVWPDAPVGAVCAGLHRFETMRPITYATIGTAYRRVLELGRIDLCFVDEAHLCDPRPQGMYRKLIAKLHALNPAMRVVGLTASPFRGDGVFLTDAEAPLFHGTAATVTIGELLAEGYLAPLTVPAVPTTRLIDTRGVRITAGDFNIGQLAKVSDRDTIVEQACDQIVEHGAGRFAWLAFCVTVDHAEHVCAALQRRGIAAAVVTGETPADERRQRIAEFRAGRLRCLVTVLALLTGFDVPQIDLIAWLRSTRSPVLYMQGMGRGLRPAPGKSDCLVLDFTDTTAVLGPVDAITGRPRAPRMRDAEAPFRVCPQCGSQNATRALECVDCGHPFPPPELVNHRAEASTAAVLSGASKVVRHAVTGIRYARHAKPGRPDSLRIEYEAGLRVVAREWCALELPGYPREKAAHWWKRRGGDPVPANVTEALERKDELRVPAAVLVDESGKYAEVRGYEWR